jgi:F-type H+-transporting ATPase subunit b
MHFDATFFAFVALAIFLVIVYRAGAHQKIASSLDSRAARIKQDLEDARRLRLEAEGLLAEYKKKRLDAEKEAQDIIAQAKSEAEAFAADARKKLTESIERRTQQAEQKIAQAEAAAVKDVRNAAVEIAVAAAHGLVADVAKGSKGAALIEESIAAVKARLN